jgi:hypothetical protein
VYRLEALKLDRLAQAETFQSQSKQAELRGQAAAIDATQAEKRAELINHDAEYARAQATDALNRYKALGDAAVQRSQVAENYAAAAAHDRANRSEAEIGGEVRLARLPMTCEDILVPKDI